MKTFYKKLNIALVVIYVLGIIFLAYYLFNLSDVFLQHIDLSQMEAITPYIRRGYLVITVLMVVGLTANIIALYLLNYSKGEEKIIYVEKTKEEKQAEKEKLQKEREVNYDVNQLNNIQSRVKDKKPGLQLKNALLSSICAEIEASQAVLYDIEEEEEKRYIHMAASYAFSLPESERLRYEFGEGLAGQVAKEGKKVNIDKVPEGYITILSGLGSSSPKNLIITPVLDGDNVVAVAEFSSFKKFSEADEKLIDASLQQLIGKKGGDANPKKEDKKK